MKIFAEKVLGTVGWLSAISCPLSEAMQPFYTTRGVSRHHHPLNPLNLLNPLNPHAAGV